MEKYFFLFEISNNQNEYAKCSKFIDDIYSNRMVKGQYQHLSVKYCRTDASQMVCKELLMGIGFQNWDGENICAVLDKEFVFIFHVMCSNEDDVVNLLYFCLLKEQHPRSILCVDSQNLGKAGGTVPYYLYDEIKKYMPKRQNGTVQYISGKYATQLDYNKFDYFINTAEHGIIPMTLPKQKTIRKFSTLIEIDQNYNTSRLWGESVGNCLRELYLKAGWKWNRQTDNDYIYKNYWPNIIPKVLLNNREQVRKISREGVSARQDKFAQQYPVYRLFVVFTECLCTMLYKNRIDLARKRYRIIQTEKFFAMIKDMPLLALYIFCLFDVASKDETELQKKEEEVINQLQEQIFDARDMAEGLLQIIENVYHSEYHKGYFYFRIHTLENGDNKYLKQNYSQYLQQEIFNCGKSRQHVLEVKVADYSHKTIPQMFSNNYDKRKRLATGNDLKKYEELYEAAQKITLRSFFAPETEQAQFWQEYNNIAENVVHHYGLQAFDSFVMNNRGYFYVQSKADYSLDKNENFYDSLGKAEPKDAVTLPGSQYEVLIPFQVELEPQNTSLNVNINYTRNLCQKYSTVESIFFTSQKCINSFNLQPISWSYQDRKEGMIYALYQELLNKIENQVDDNTVLWCSASQIALTMTEIFCKVIMLYIVSRGVDRNCYLMVTDCTEAHFIEITRMISLFYNKRGISPGMKNVQIYLSGENNEEFLLAGNSLGAITTKAEKLAFARGVTPECVRILNLMLKNKVSEKADDIEIIPFDMIQYGDSRQTLFEKNVDDILNTDIQSEHFGCKLEKLHVRIGNKIHITTFYEAELLFHNNYYISRFAYWLAREIGKTGIDASKSITLVGYETYSEMLLHEVREMLPDFYNISVSRIDCIIYEQKSIEKFRAPRALNEYVDSQFLLIVPINTTTTTHSKLAGFLQQAVSHSCRQVEGRKANSSINIVGNYGIILIGSGTEQGKHLQQQYWEKVEDNVLYSKVLQQKIVYFLVVEGTWHNPLLCEKCFPKDDSTLEQPLIETNKESIVPMHAIKIKRICEKRGLIPDFSKQDEEEFKKVVKLSEYLIYSHVVRKGNHFNYYFLTEKYFGDPSVERDVIEWLKQCKTAYENTRTTDGTVFDIIVSPQHFSNAAFTNAVNKYFFNDAALVLHFDIEKEFRNNVKTKYSNLITLYRNLCAYGVNATINFHFMDDTIVSGATFTRAHSLMKSIFPNEKSKVKINIFASIIVLINRMSEESKRNYIENTSFFYSYANLRISSMRNHEDACVLCKKEKEYMLLAEQASLNEVYLYWKKKSERYQYQEIENYYVEYQEEQKKNPNTSKRQKKRAAMRMICSHKVNLLLSKIVDYTEDVIEEAILTRLLIRENEPVDIEEMIAYLKVIARPFLCFSKEVKSAIFEIMLKMLNYLLMGEDARERVDSRYDQVKACFAKIIREDEQIYLIVRILINRLVELGSNYIIRKENMRKLLDYGQKVKEEDEYQFYFTYANRVKQLIFNSTDETKCLYLEYLLLYDEEYSESEDFTKEFRFSARATDERRWLKKIFLENTRVIIKGIDYLCLEDNTGEESMENTLNQNYYLENYARLLQFHKILEKKENRYQFLCGEFRKTEGMVKLKKQLNEILQPMKKKYEKYETKVHNDLYRELLENMVNAAGAVNGEFVVPYQNGGEKSYITLDLRNFSAEMLSDTDLIGLVEKNYLCLEDSTVKIIWDHETFADTEMDGAYVLIRYGGQSSGERISEIYLVLHFEKITGTQLYIAIRNILVFRMDIWKAFNLTGSALLQNWMNDRFFKLQMRKARSGNHSEIDDLLRNLDMVQEKYENGSTKVDKELLASYLSLTLDSMIGYYNTKILAGEFKDNSGNASVLTLKEYWFSIKGIVNAASGLWGLRLVDGNSQPFYYETLSGNVAKYKVGEKLTYPDFTVCEVIILSALQSIKNHPQDNNRDVMIYREGKYLYIKNKLAHSLDEVEQKLYEAKKREGAGISIAMIIDTFRIWYDEQDIVFVDKENKFFVVRLPIVEMEENI